MLFQNTALCFLTFHNSDRSLLLLLNSKLLFEYSVVNAFQLTIPCKAYFKVSCDVQSFWNPPNFVILSTIVLS